MPSETREKRPRNVSIGVFDVFGSSRHAKAIEEARKQKGKRREERKKKEVNLAEAKLGEVKSAEASAGPKDNKSEKLAAPAPDAVKVQGEPEEINAEELEKERQALVARIQEISSKIGKKSGKGKGKEKGESKGQATVADDEKSAPQDTNKGGKKNGAQKQGRNKKAWDNQHDSNTDPTIPEAMATAEDIVDYGIENTPRAPMKWQHCALLLRIHEFYENRKYLAIASKFSDLSGINMTAGEAKAIILGSYRENRKK